MIEHRNSLQELSKLLIAGTILASPAAAQATPGTTILGALIGDPDSPFATGLPFPASPSGNPFVEPSHSDRPFVDAQAQLGKALFWDEQLSSDNTMSCGTCHAFEAGGTEVRDAVLNRFMKFGSRGVLPQDGAQDYFAEPQFSPSSGVLTGPGTPNSHKRTTPLFAPSMINAAFFDQLFWQKRIGPEFEDLNGWTFTGLKEYAALEALSVDPPVSPTEMGHDQIDWASGSIQAKLASSEILRLATPFTVPPDIQHLLGTTYEAAFDDLYGVSTSGSAVTRKRIGMVLAQYMRTLISDQAPVLLPNGLTQPQLRAFERMRDSSCFSCHSISEVPEFHPDGGFVEKFDGILSNGEKFDILESPHDMAPNAETGQLEIARMKVPSLLNLGIRRRFFHSGHIEGIDDLLAFFNSELATAPQVAFDPPLNALEKISMRSLWTDGFVDPRVANETFPFDSPGLQSERLTLMGPQENQFGSSTFQTRPVLFSSSPATYGEGWFKAGLAHARPNAFAQFGLAAGTASGPNGLLLDNTVVWSPPIQTDGDGYATWWITSLQTLPPGMVGTSWIGQWRTQDPLGPQGMAVTRAAGFGIF